MRCPGHFSSFTLVSVLCLVAQSCLTLCDPMHCSLPGYSVHGIFQARTLEWAAISSSRVSSLLRDQTRIFCIASRFFTTVPPRKPPLKAQPVLNPDFTLILSNSIIVTRVKEESEVMIFIITPVSRWVKYAEDVDSIPGFEMSTVVWMFFGVALLWDWNEHWRFPVLCLLLSFPNLLTYWVQHFHSITF